MRNPEKRETRKREKPKKGIALKTGNTRNTKNRRIPKQKPYKRNTLKQENPQTVKSQNWKTPKPENPKLRNP